MATRTTSKTTQTEAPRVEEVNVEMPSWKRNVAALLANILTAAGITAAGVTIFNTLATAAMAVTGSMFIALFIYYAGMTLSILAAMLAGFLVQNMIIEGGVAKLVSAKCEGVLGAARGWFTKEKAHVC